MSISKLLEGLSSSDDLSFTLSTLKRGDKIREIAKPSQALYELHQRLLKRMRGLKCTMPNATGGVFGSSPMKNAERHIHGQHFFIVDFKDAYSSIDPWRLARVLVSLDPTLGTVTSVVNFLLEYFFHPLGGITQGGPASPDLFNMYCEAEFDSKIRTLLHERIVEGPHDGQPVTTMTRYFDDVVFSSPVKPIHPELRRKIRRVAKEAGFILNEKKTKILVAGRDEIAITGVKLQRDGHFGFTREYGAKLGRELSRWLVIRHKKPAQILGLVGHYKGLRLRMVDNHDTRRLDTLVSQVERVCRVGKGKAKVAPLQTLPLFGPLRFSGDFLRDLRNRVVMAEYARDRLKMKIKRSGYEFRCLCPFHNEKTPSLFFNDRKSFFHCFGCGAHGDAIGFVMRSENVSFVEAVRKLAHYAGMSIPDESLPPRERRSSGGERGRLL